MGLVVIPNTCDGAQGFRRREAKRLSLHDLRECLTKLPTYACNVTLPRADQTKISELVQKTYGGRL